MKDVDYMCSKFIERRDYIYNKLKSLGFELNLPRGAFYVFPSIKNFNMKSEEFCEKLLKEAKVAVVPGSAFGTKGEGHIRISYAYSMDKLKTSMGKIEDWIASHF
jgi:aminotransferase